MPPVKIKLLPHYKGDHWSGMAIGPILINDLQPGSQLASCRMHFRDEYGSLGHAFKTSPGAGEGTITIDDATTWEITVPVQALDLESGTWDWDFETTDANGTVLTLYVGTIKVIGDVTS